MGILLTGGSDPLEYMSMSGNDIERGEAQIKQMEQAVQIIWEDLDKLTAAVKDDAKVNKLYSVLVAGYLRNRRMDLREAAGALGVNFRVDGDYVFTADQTRTILAAYCDASIATAKASPKKYVAKVLQFWAQLPGDTVMEECHGKAEKALDRLLALLEKQGFTSPEEYYDFFEEEIPAAETAAVEKDTAHIEEAVKKYACGDLTEDGIRAKYGFGLTIQSRREETAKRLAELKDETYLLSVYGKSLTAEERETLKAKKAALIKGLEKRLAAAEEEDQRNTEDLRERYDKHLADTDIQIQALYAGTVKQKKKNRRILAVCAVLCAALVLGCQVHAGNAYKEALALKNAGQYEAAITAFTALNDYKDSEEQIAACREAINEIAYNEALTLKDAGQYEEAIAAFTALKEYNDSVEQAAACREAYYNEAHELVDAGQYEAATAVYKALGEYKDSKKQAEYLTMYTIHAGDEIVLTVNGEDVSWDLYFYCLRYSIEYYRGYLISANVNVPDWNAVLGKTTYCGFVLDEAETLLKSLVAIEQNAVGSGADLPEADLTWAKVDAPYVTFITGSKTTEEEKIRALFLLGSHTPGLVKACYHAVYGSTGGTETGDSELIEAALKNGRKAELVWVNGNGAPYLAYYLSNG